MLVLRPSPSANGNRPVLKFSQASGESPRVLLPGASIVPPRPYSVDALDIDASMRSFVFAASRVHGRVHDASPGRVVDRLEFERASSDLRALLQGFLADIGAAADRLDARGSQSVCSILDKYLGMILRIERVWSIFEFFHLSGATSFFCFETINWLQSFIAMSYHVPVEERVAEFAASSRPEVLVSPRPDHASGEPRGVALPSVFWEDIHRLVVRGRLSDAWSLLQLHSELRAVVEYTSSSEDRRDHAVLRDLFMQHPIGRVEETLAARKAGALSIAEMDGISDIYTKEWSRWHALAERVRSDPHFCPLLARVPQLHNIICLLAGDGAVIVDNASKYRAVEALSDSIAPVCWRTLALMELLYSPQNAPPCSKANTASVLERALKKQYGNQWPEIVEDRPDDASVAQCLMNILKGNMFSALRYIFELSVQSPISECIMRRVPNGVGERSRTLAVASVHPGGGDDEQTDADVAAAASMSFGIVALGAFAHLLLLLDKSSILPLTTFKSLQGDRSLHTHSGAQLLEDIILEFATKLNAASFPIDIVASYICCCPNRGRAGAAALIAQRIFMDETEVDAASHILRQMGLHNEADQIESCRGIQWMQKGEFMTSTYLPSAEHKISLLGCFLGCGLKSKRSSLAIVKAASYFVRAGDQSRLLNVFEAAWQACVSSFYAVARASLKRSNTVPVSDDSVSGRIIASFVTLSLSNAEEISATDECTGVIISGIRQIENYYARDRKSTTEPEHELLQLQRTIDNVKMLFDVISQFTQLPVVGVRETSPGASSLAVCLVRYVEALELVLACLVQHALSCDDACSSFTKASQLLWGLLCESSIGVVGACSSLAAPSRHFVHLLDTCVWMSEAMLPRTTAAASGGSVTSQRTHDASRPLGTILSRSQLGEMMRAQHCAREATSSSSHSMQTGNASLIDSIGRRVLRLYMNSIIESNRTCAVESEGVSLKSKQEAPGTLGSLSISLQDFRAPSKSIGVEAFFYAS